MPPPLDVQIRAYVARYLSGDLTLRELQEWLAPVSWNIHRAGNQTAMDLAYDIELSLAEYTNGDWTEDELKDLLRPLVEFRPVSAGQPE
ncbi:MAG: hypothetical protein HY691_20840 [Chloroflexi bacterium]|nr:hypothetical protein [Chloroflexota bacterium]